MYFNPLDIRRIIYPRASGLITFDPEEERRRLGIDAQGRKIPYGQPGSKMPAPQPITQPVPQPAPQPITQPITQPDPQVITQPIAQPIIQPGQQFITQPGQQVITQPAVEKQIFELPTGMARSAPAPELMVKMPPRQPIMKNPNIEAGFYDSEEYKNLPTLGTQEMRYSPYFGQQGSGSVGAATDAAYEAYLKRTGNTGYLQGGDKFKKAESNILSNAGPLMKTDGTTALPSSLQKFLDQSKVSIQEDMQKVQKDQQGILAKYGMQPGEQPDPNTQIGRAINKEMQELPSVLNLKTKQQNIENALRSNPEYQKMKSEAALNSSMQNLTNIQTELNTLSNDPVLSEVGEDGQPTEAAKAAQQKITDTQTRLQAANVQAQNAQAQANLPIDIAKRQLTSTAITDPASLAKQAETAKVNVQPDQFIPADTGQAGAVDLASTTIAGPAGQAIAPGSMDASKIDPTMVAEEARQEAAKVTGATGTVSKEIQAQEGQLSEEAKAQGVGFDAQRVDSVEGGTRKVTAEEQIEAAGGDEEAVKAKIAQANIPDNIKAAQTTVKSEELPDAAQIAESDMAQAQAATNDGLNQDAVAVAAKLQKFSVDAGTLAKAAEGDVTAQDTVQGQLSSLMASFDDGTPAWAAGAMRAANDAMLSRGMGGSSMAGAAIFQAAMESALPIAAQDAQTFSRMNLTNLNNRQQVALSNAAAQQGLQLQNLNNEQQVVLQNSTNAFALQSQNLSNMQQTVLANAQIKASLQGQNLSNQQQANLVTAARYAEAANLNLNNKQQSILQDNANSMTVEIANLNSKQQAYLANAQLEAALQGKQIDNQQQAAILNAAKFSDANNITFTAQEQAKIHNSELMKTIGLAELSAEQAATLQNAAKVASMDMANLSNRQQAQVQNAQNFLAMDMSNLSNEQQATLFKAQAMQTALLSDQAADNAARQFNAASQNQTDQFMAGLTTDITKFNTAQSNAMKQFDADAINATAKFNAQLKNQRTEFNVRNALVISQANAQWRQNVATLDQAAQNDANMLLAKSQNAFTQNTVDQIWQRERDLMSMAWKSSESEQDRINNIVRQQLANDGSLDVNKLQADARAAEGIGSGLFDIFKFAVTGAFA